MLLTNSDTGTDDVSGLMVAARMRWRWLGCLEPACGVGVGGKGSLGRGGEVFHVKCLQESH